MHVSARSGMLVAISYCGDRIYSHVQCESTIISGLNALRGYRARGSH